MPSQERPPLFTLWDLLALAGFAALWVLYLQVAPGLPALVPTHFDALGRPNGWTPKAALPWVIFGLPLFIYGLTTVIGMATSTGQQDPAKARAAAMAPLRGLLGLGLAILMGCLLLQPTYGAPALWTGLGSLLALLLAGTVALVRSMATLPSTAASRAFYKWGLFYVNPEDPRIWVEKPIGIGWTLNFGRPVSWLVLALLLLPAVAAVLIGRKASH